jgi:hypothetical protein
VDAGLDPTTKCNPPERMTNKALRGKVVLVNF